MIRTITLNEFMLEELNRQLAESDRDVRVVSQRPKPTLATAFGDVVKIHKPQPRGSISNDQ